MGCKDCGKAFKVTDSKPYRKPVVFPHGSDLRIILRAIKDTFPFDFDTVAIELRVYEPGTEFVKELPDAKFVFGDSYFLRSQSPEAAEDVDVTWDDVVLFEQAFDSDLISWMCYDVEHPFVVRFRDKNTNATLTRWASYLIKQPM